MKYVILTVIAWYVYKSIRNMVRSIRAPQTHFDTPFRPPFDPKVMNHQPSPHKVTLEQIEEAKWQELK